MSMQSSSHRQFSLRALLLLMLAVAVSLALWRALDAMVLWALPAAALLAWLTVAPCRSWKRAGLVSGLAVYGPFAAMGIYTLLFVSCSHCKAAAWTMFPAAPGVIPIELFRRWLDLDRPAEAIWFSAAIVCSAGLWAALAWLVRSKNRWLRAVSVIATLAYGAWAAIVILALIRA